MSTAGVIGYCLMSEAMKSLPKLDWLRKGIRLPLGTVTASLAADPRRVSAGERVRDQIDVPEWLGGPRRETVTEESLGLGTYGEVLTVLTST